MQLWSSNMHKKFVNRHYYLLSFLNLLLFQKMSSLDKRLKLTAIIYWMHYYRPCTLNTTIYPLSPRCTFVLKTVRNCPFLDKRLKLITIKQMGSSTNSNMGRWFLTPTISSALDNSWVSYNSTQFWHNLPGESLRLHKLTVQFHKTTLSCNFKHQI